MILQDNLGPHGDAVYAALMDLHDGLSPENSHALNARLVLILANEIGDPKRLQALMHSARAGMTAD
jgi:hypothetical protein